MQIPPHISLGALQEARAMHAPPTQAWPAPQRLSQRPQCSVEPRGSTQEPPHRSSGALHVAGASAVGTPVSSAGPTWSAVGPPVSMGVGVSIISTELSPPPASAGGVTEVPPPRAEHAAVTNSPTTQDRVLSRMVARSSK
jgi:hypothetical protein